MTASFSSLTLKTNAARVTSVIVAVGFAQHLLQRGTTMAELERIVERAQAASSRGVRQVQCHLSTSHSAKGDENYAVALANDFVRPFSDNGNLDIDSDGILLEEIHVLYVAMTRATHILILPPDVRATIQHVSCRMNPTSKKRARDYDDDEDNQLECDNATEPQTPEPELTK